MLTLCLCVFAVEKEEVLELEIDEGLDVGSARLVHEPYDYGCDKRLHTNLGYKTPKQVFDQCKTTSKARKKTLNQNLVNPFQD